jgi:hypothetical protein
MLTGLSFSPTVFDTSAGSQSVNVTLTMTDDLSGGALPGAFFRSVILFVSPSGGQARGGSFTLSAGTPLSGTWVGTVFFPQFSEGGTWQPTVILLDGTANLRFLSTATLTAMGLPTELTIAAPSGTEDGTAGAGGGTVEDLIFGSSAAVTFPPGSLPGPTTVSIDVLSEIGSPLAPTPAGFSVGTLFVNIGMEPTPPMPFPAPGLTVVLPFSTFRAPGLPITLYRLDPVTGTLVPAVSVLGGPVIGTVNAAFTGISKLSTVVGFVQTGVLGDTNGDAQVDCTDLEIIRSSFGRRAGQPGFDFRADLNRNNVVDVSDLALVSRQLSAGTMCQ